MKKLLSMVMVLGLVLVLGRMAMAGDTNTVTVTANVVGTCKFNSATSTLAFGALDPSSGAPASATASPTFWCTKNATYSVSDDDGLYEVAAGSQSMKHASLNEYVPYTFTYNPTTGTGQGRTTNITLNVSGTVAFADYQNASAGDYGDTVVISITP